MDIYEALSAVSDAKRTLESADRVSLSAAKLIVGRLRTVKEWNSETLKALKKELRDFNSATGKWKEDP